MTTKQIIGITIIAVICIIGAGYLETFFMNLDKSMSEEYEEVARQNMRAVEEAQRLKEQEQNN